MTPASPTRIRRTTVLVAALGLLALGVFSVAPVWAQTAPPNSYYGVAESASGTLAPSGTTIVAVANGEVQDSITVGGNGRYGSSDPTGEKLRVSSGIDSTITFHVDTADGPRAEETDPDPTAEVEELDLTFPAGTFGGPTTTQTPTATPTRSDTQTPAGTSTPTPTPTRTATQTSAGTSTPTATTSGTSTPTDSPAPPTRSAPGPDSGAPTSPAGSDSGQSDPADDRVSTTTRDAVPAGPNVSDTATATGSTEGGGLVPWGLLRAGFVYLALPILLVYGVLKALAIYYGY